MTPSARRVPMSHDPTGQPPASVNRRRCAVGAERVDGVKPTIVASNGIEIAYETFGAPDSRPLLLVADLGAQMLAWHPDQNSRLSLRPGGATSINKLSARLARRFYARNRKMRC